MAMTEPSASIRFEEKPVSVAIADAKELTPFERIVARMKGTGRIVGDIVSPDPEQWDCEVD